MTDLSTDSLPDGKRDRQGDVGEPKNNAPAPAYLDDEELIQSIEMLFYAYRDFTSDPDEILKNYGFGRAHHRAVHFIGRNPGMTVAELLTILKVTKQSLSRVLSQLVAEEYVRQVQGSRDRRQRLLYLTDKGEILFEKLSGPQKARIAKAYRNAGAEAVAGYRKVLVDLLNADEREGVLRSVERS